MAELNTDVGKTHVRVSIPNERRYFEVAYLTLGDAVSRMELGYEAFDDIQLALEMVLSAKLTEADDLSIDLEVTADGLTLWIGPFAESELPDKLDGDARGIALRRVLEQLVDTVDAQAVDGEHGLVLRKRT